MVICSLQLLQQNRVIMIEAGANIIPERWFLQTIIEMEKVAELEKKNTQMKHS